MRNSFIHIHIYIYIYKNYIYRYILLIYTSSSFIHMFIVGNYETYICVSPESTNKDYRMHYTDDIPILIVHSISVFFGQIVSGSYPSALRPELLSSYQEVAQKKGQRFPYLHIILLSYFTSIIIDKFIQYYSCLVFKFSHLLVV